MKSQKILLILICLFIVSQISFAQEKSKAVLVDVIENTNCESLSVRMRLFIDRLNSEPSSQGYVVIYGDNKYLRLKLRYELWINGEIKSSRFASDRIVKIRGTELGNPRIEFWLVPFDAEKPSFGEVKWNFVFTTNTKPFVFHDDYSDQICSFVSFEKVFVEYLNANPEARGHIVIYEKSRKKYLARKKEAQNLLSAIPQNRLRFFQVKSDNTNMEFWLVPKKKK